MSDPADLFFADVQQIANAARRHVEHQAYLLTGGSNGCAWCREKPLAEKIAVGHEKCAIESIRAKAGSDLAANLGDLWIFISRAMSDPRMFQWVGTYDPMSGWEPSVTRERGA